MSKTINPDKMSKFDRQYLEDRGIDPDEYASKWQLGEDGQLTARVESEDEEPPAVENQADEQPESEGPVADAENAAPEPESEGEGESEGEDVPYTEWTDEELATEVKSRGLKGSKVRETLIERLEASDAEANDEDDA